MKKAKTKWKSLLSMLLCINMVASTMFPGSTVSAENTSQEPKAAVEVTKYVSETGDDTNGDGSEAKPYATVSKAEAMLEANNGADTGRIVISGSVPYTASEHKKMMTITGDGQPDTELRLGEGGNLPTRIYGPTTMEQITLKTPETYENNGLIKTYTDELVLGQGVVVSGPAHGYFRVGNPNWEAGKADGTGNTPTLTIDDISHSDSTKQVIIRVGTGDGQWMNGANITINGGTINQMNIHRPTQFSKDVNIVVNGGTIQDLTSSVDTIPGTYLFNKALQIVFNNGTSADGLKKDQFDKITSNVGKWYMYGAQGVSLSVTETAGTFEVHGDKGVVATLKSDTSQVYSCNPGKTLVVPAGEYDVTLTEGESGNHPPKDSKMIELDVTTDGKDQIFGQNVNLEQGKTYAISFQYAFEEGEMNTAAYLQMKAKLGSGTYTTYRSSHLTGDKGFDSVTYNEETRTATYTFTHNEATGEYGIGFTCVKPAKLYLANATMYDVTDTTKKNILPSAGTEAENLNGWRSDWKTAGENQVFQLKNNSDVLMYTATQKEYSENTFAPSGPPEKNMLYVKSDGTSNDCFVQDVNIEPGVQYTVSYDYKVVNGQINGRGAYLALMGGAGSMKVNKTYRNSFLDDKTQKFDDIEDNGIRIKCTFTLSNDEVDASGNYKIGFYFADQLAGKSAEFYIANFKVYATNDSNQTNLLKNDGSEKNMYGWYSNWRSAAEGSEAFDPSSNLTKYTAKYVGYKEEYFKPMLHVINGGEDNSDLMQNVILEKGKTYTISFKYKYITGYEDYSVYFAVGKEAPQKIDTPIYYYQSHGTNEFDKVTYGTEWSEISYEFTMDDSSLNNGKNTCSVGFRFVTRSGCSTEMYIADMVLYESTSPDKKTNLLSGSSFEDGMYGWHGAWRSAAKDSLKFQEFPEYSNRCVATYVPYLEESFKKIGYGDANQDTHTDILDLVRQMKLIHANEYSPYADSNKDGKLTIADLTTTKKHLIGTEEIQNLITPYKVQNGAAETQANSLKDQIRSNSDTVSASTAQRTYYVDAENGKDTNTGTDTNHPLKTIAKVNTLTLSSGDVVLFKRGSVFRTAEPLNVRNYVKYGAYGTGEKPQFLGSLKDYGEVSWSTTGTEGVWKLNETVAGEAGVVTFDGDTAVGNRVLSVDQLRKNGDYYHDYTGDGSFYLYLKGANPTEYFKHIEIGSTERIISGMWKDDALGIKYAKKNITIENIAMKYCANTAMEFSHSDHITIKGCEFLWVGGAYNKSSKTCYGNGLTLWRDNEYITVDHCLFYQIYDAAVTFQGDKPNYDTTAEGEIKTVYRDIAFTNLLIEYSSMNFEYWGSNSTLWKGNDQIADTSDDKSYLKPVTVMQNISFTGNMVRFGGYGFGGMNRQYKASQGCLLGWKNEYYDTDTIENFKIQNNTFDRSDCYIFYSPESLNQRMTISGNTYYQGKSSYLVNHGSSVAATNQATLEEAIRTFDSAPAKIQWTE